MKKAILTVISFIIFVNIVVSQGLNLGVQAGPGIIDLDFKARSLGGALLIKPGNVPFVISPYFEGFRQTDHSRSYYGANLLIMNKLISNFYLGAGVGKTKWNVLTYSRDALTYNIILGLRLRATEKVGIFLEGKYFLNSQTDKDTELFNSQSPDTPAFLFDNDIFVSAGLIFKIL